LDEDLAVTPLCRHIPRPHRPAVTGDKNVPPEREILDALFVVHVDSEDMFDLVLIGGFIEPLAASGGGLLESSPGGVKQADFCSFGFEEIQFQGIRTGEV